MINQFSVLKEIRLRIVRVWESFAQSDFIRKVLETFLTRIALIGIGLITTAIVARVLGPEGRGLWAVATTVGALGVQFGNFGFHSSNVYYAARDRSALRALTGNSLWVSFGVGVFGSIVMWIVFLFVPKIAPIHGLLLILSLLWIPFGLASLLLENLLLGIQEIRSFNIIELGTRIITVALLGLVIVMKAVTVEAVFATGLVAVFISFLCAYSRLKMNFSGYPKFSWILFKENIGFGFYAYLAAFFSFLLLQFDLLLVKNLLGDEQVGYYSTAAILANAVYILPEITGTILFPKISSMNEIAVKWKMAKRVAVGISLAIIFVIIAAVTLAGPVIKVLYGKAFVPAIPSFIWLMPGILFLSIGTVSQKYLGAIGYAGAMVTGPLAAFCFNIFCNLFLIKKYGIVGASVSSSLAYALMAVISWVISIHKTRKELTL